jgi:hypothetical protein
MIKLILIIIAAFNIILINSTKQQQDDLISCKDEITGENIDWFTLYKLPRLAKEPKHVPSPFIEYGTAYTFMTNKREEWKFSSLSMNDTMSVAGRSIDILYKNEFNSTSNIGYILYNDQADKVTIKMGHTKGILIFNDKSAIWIVHSIPHFPPKVNYYSFFKPNFNNNNNKKTKTKSKGGREELSNS